MAAEVLDPEVARRVRNLSLTARRAVEGLLSGAHRSPHRGASVVFVEHRDYRAGDDLRLLDWRAFARTDRDVVKRFEQETHLRATLVLDRSGSMAFGEEGGATRKDAHAATLLAALAYVLIGQGDAAGVITVAEDVDDVVPPRTRPAHLDALLGALAAPAEPGRSTDLRTALSGVAERAGRRGVVAIASDLLDIGLAEEGSRDRDALGPIAHLVARGHDVIVLHVMTPEELELPIHGPVRFEGLEGESPVEVDVDLIRPAYEREVARFLAECKNRCTAAGARYTLARTDEAPEHLLARILGASRRKGFR